jgi:hypothetical protein
VLAHGFYGKKQIELPEVTALFPFASLRESDSGDRVPSFASA